MPPIPDRKPGRRFGRSVRPLGLRDVIVFSLPLIALGLYLFGSSVLDYHRLRQFDDWWSHQTSVRKFGFQRLRSAVRAPRAARIEERLDPDDPRKGALQLVVDRAEWDTVSRDVAGHWGEWIEGAILDGNDFQDVRVRFRGDGSVHWTGPKKSLTVRTKRSDLYQGYRTLALTGKEVLTQYAVNALGEEAGLLAPRTRLVPVYLDRRFYGLHRLVEPVDESFLRRRARMPGNVWRGDTAERGEYFKDLPRELFKNPAIWDMVAESGRPGDPGRATLEAFLTDLQGDTLAHHARLWRRLDREELARLLALCLIAGDPFHMSGIHNQFWYEDPTSGVLHPILWDLRALELDDPPPGSNVNHFWRSALRDPRLWARTLAWTRRFLDERDLVGRARELAREAEARFADELAYERLREGVISPPGSASEVARVLAGNAERLRGWIADGRAAWSAVETADGAWIVDLVVEGRAPLRLRGFELEGDPRASGEPGLEVERAGAAPIVPEPVRGGLVGVEDGLRWSPEELEELPAGCTGEGPALEPEALAYRYLVRDRGGLVALRPVLVNALTGDSATLRALEPGEPLPEGRAWHPWSFAAPAGRVIELSGEAHLTEDLVLGPADRLEIAPGTRLRLDPDVSILSRGVVVAAGEPSSPIVFQPAVAGAPWGTLALQGAGTSSSRFAHVRFTGGACARLEGVEYKGMVSVHGARGVLFEGCTFTQNQRCDDALNVVASRVDLHRSLFEDCNLDAVDYDLSTGRIERCRFVRSGNDGLDLMTAFPSIVGCTIEDSADKGISIGEGSGPVIVDTTIEGCVTGVQTKDRSRPILLRTRVTDCEVGLHQYVKNWRYDGPGWARVVASRLEGNGVDYSGADGAYLTSLASRIESVTPASGLAPLDELDGDASWWGATERDERLVGRDATGVLSEVSTAGVVAGEDYADETADPTGGWEASGGVLNLRLRRGGLRARVLDDDGVLARDLDLALESGELEHRLVLELAGEGLAAIDVALAHSAGDFTLTRPLGAEPGHYRYVVVPVPAGTLESVTLTLRLDGAQGRFFLRSWHLWELPCVADE